jgi:hypothetical protein
MESGQVFLCYNFTAMKTIALTVLLAVMQAGPPIPRKAADNPTQAAANVKQKSASSQGPSVSAPSSVKTDSYRPTKTNSSEQHSEDAGNDIGISKLPTVSLNPSRRDAADWGYWFFSLLLVVVGFLQIWLLYGTLRAIQRQADSMKDQTTHLRRSVIFARKSSNAAKKSADDAYSSAVFAEKTTKLVQRADILLFTAEVETTPPGNWNAHTRPILVFRNFGQSRGRDVRIQTKIFTDSRSVDQNFSEPATVLGSEQDRTVKFPTFVELMHPNIATEINGGQTVLKISGSVSYVDVFDEVRFCRFYAVIENRAIRIEKNEAD